ncbi:NAD-dependent epimerase/dehydratase family protein [Niabella yanshanensis]|uniref:NAD-dependent epimerase/dehydratase family protein n=1 Tax=Niabella yanshanensis TaxID=577386 RepID=A0ABZ0W4L5_9BACT|nr:NAD-dependent epimerase/dehydratase family protein [Niabella yanshanensis]WQD37050.1 NAD-dependent epimerase/dehydratase family protein [Niabella yanshanensis]
MTVLVTGISGLLGTNLVLLLLEKGYQVKGVARNISSLPFGKHPRLILIQSELTADLSAHLKDTDCVIHVAALTQQNIIHYDEYYRVNHTATALLAEGAIAAGVRQFIYVSTANTIGYGIQQDGLKDPEDQPMRKPFDHSFYARSKAAAEAYLLQQTHRIKVHIANPTFMIGPYDSKPSSGAIILMGMHKRLLFYPPGGKNFVAVKDVASGIEKMIHQGENGRRYLLAGNDNLSYRDFFKLLKEHTGQKQRMIPIPSFLLQVAGCIGDLLRQFSIKTSLCTNNMRILNVKNYYSNKTSVKELGMQYQDIKAAIAESVTYFEKHFPG